MPSCYRVLRKHVTTLKQLRPLPECGHEDGDRGIERRFLLVRGAKSVKSVAPWLGMV